MEKTFKVSDLKRFIAESSEEFKPLIGKNVEKDDKSNNDKAYSDAKKRAKEFDGGLADTGGKRAKYEKTDANRTTLDYEPENASDDYKKRIKAQAEGYTSEAEKNNKIEKSGDYSDNENIFNGIKKSGQELHKGEKDMKKSGLQGNKWPDKVFDKEEMYESKEGFDMKQMINRMRILQENSNGALDDFYKEADDEGKYGEPGMVKSYHIGFNNNVDAFERDAQEEGMTLEEYLKYWWNEISSEGIPFTWQKLGSGYGFHGEELAREGNVIFKDIYGQLMVDESASGENEYNDDFMSRVKNAQAGTSAEGLMEHKNIKTVYFKKTTFLTEGHMLSRIPDEFKNEGEQFRMKDKTGNIYLIEWKNNKGIIKEHKNAQGFNESLERMKNLYSYSSKDTETSMKSRLNEDDNFNLTLDKARKIIK